MRESSCEATHTFSTIWILFPPAEHSIQRALRRRSFASAGRGRLAMVDDTCQFIRARFHNLQNCPRVGVILCFGARPWFRITDFLKSCVRYFSPTGMRPKERAAAEMYRCLFRLNNESTPCLRFLQFEVIFARNSVERSPADPVRLSSSRIGVRFGLRSRAILSTGSWRYDGSCDWLAAQVRNRIETFSCQLVPR
jgi:hypothetical protein